MFLSVGSLNVYVVGEKGGDSGPNGFIWYPCDGREWKSSCYGCWSQFSGILRVIKIVHFWKYLILPIPVSFSFLILNRIYDIFIITRTTVAPRHHFVLVGNGILET